MKASPLRSLSARTSPQVSLRAAGLGVLLLAWGLLLFRLNDVPPGLQHDQMFDVIDALGILRGQHRFYFPANFGREPLIMYGAAAILRLTGGHFVWSLRFAGVVWSMLGLAATISLARRYLPGWAALLAGALMCGSFWFLFAGRLGLEPIPLLALAPIMFYCLARALAQPRAWPFFSLAGLVGGLGVYTYLAGRALYAIAPLLLIYEGARFLWARLRAARKSNPQALAAPSPVPGLWLTFVVQVLAGSPLLLYVRAHPEVADQRVGEVGGALVQALHGDFARLWTPISETIQALLWASPPLLPYHYSLPGRPVLQPVLAVLFLLGLAAILAGCLGLPIFGRSSARRERQQCLLLAALLAGLAPSLLSSADALSMRSIVALPVLFIMVAQGAWQVYRLVGTSLARLNPPLSRTTNALPMVWGSLFLVLLIWQVIDNGQAYFSDWARAERTQRIYNADLRAAATYLSDQPQDEQVLIGTDRLMDLDEQTYLLYGPKRRDVRWFQSPQNPPLPSGDRAFYLLTGSMRKLPPALDFLSGIERERVTLPSPEGRYDYMRGFRLYRRDIDAALSDAAVREIRPALAYGSALRLEAAGMQDQGAFARLVSQWTVLGPWQRPQQPPKFSVSLWDASSYRWAQTDALTALPYETWRPGETYLETTRFPLPADLPPGDYQVRLSIYSDTSKAMPVMREGAFVSDAPVVATVTITEGAGRTPPPAPPQVAQPEPGAQRLKALGRWESLDYLVAGVPAELHVSWQATESLNTPGLHFHAQALDPDNHVVWQQDVPAASGLPPVWRTGQVYRLTHPLKPESAQAGNTEVRLRLCAEGKTEVLGCALIAASHLINRPPLLGLPQAPQRVTQAHWNGNLALAGYDLVRASQSVSLTLYWQTQVPPASSFKRFVHLDAPEGHVVAQSDGFLENGGIPMPFWRTGEYVIDQVSLTWPPDQEVEALYVGFYDPETGDRLRLNAPQSESPPQHRYRIPLP